MKDVLPLALLAIHSVAYGALFLMQDPMQERHRPTFRLQRPVGALLGKSAPPELVKLMGHLPSTAIIFPECSSCSVSDPRQIRRDRLLVPVVLVLAGGTELAAAKYRDLEPAVQVKSGPASLAEYFQLGAAPRVVRVSGEGKITFVQQRYVSDDRLHEVVNGN